MSELNLGLALSQIKVSYLELILQLMNNFHNETMEFHKPHLRNSLRYVYPLFVFLHACVAIVGSVGNVYMLKLIFNYEKRLYKQSTMILLVNLAFSDLIKCIIVLPLTLAHLLIQNWIFGSFLCIFLPMLQYFPVHATTLTFLVIGIDRYRSILYPMKSRLPLNLLIAGIWIASICIVLPYAIYVMYIDLEAILGVQFHGVGLCVKKVDRNTKEYLRAVFILLYVLPLVVLACLFLKVSAELSVIKKNEEDDLALSRDRASASHHQHPLSRYCFRDNYTGISPVMTRFHEDSDTAVSVFIIERQDPSPVPANIPQSSMWNKETNTVPQSSCQSGKLQTSPNEIINENNNKILLNPISRERNLGGSQMMIDLDDYDERLRQNSKTMLINKNSLVSRIESSESLQSENPINVEQELLAQQYLVTMIVIYAVCWCPLNILVFAMHFVFEDEHNTANIDITYLTFIWFAFLSTCGNPILFIRWQSTQTKPPKISQKFIQKYLNIRPGHNKICRRKDNKRDPSNHYNVKATIPMMGGTSKLEESSQVVHDTGPDR